MWSLGSLTRDQTLTPALEGRVLTTGLPRKSWSRALFWTMYLYIRLLTLISLLRISRGTSKDQCVQREIHLPSQTWLLLWAPILVNATLIHSGVWARSRSTIFSFCSTNLVIFHLYSSIPVPFVSSSAHFLSLIQLVYLSPWSCSLPIHLSKLARVTTLNPWYSEYGPRTSTIISITQELSRNVKSSAPPHICWIRICIYNSHPPPDNTQVHRDLRSIALK